jgi:hypothetical protein
VRWRGGRRAEEHGGTELEWRHGNPFGISGFVRGTPKPNIRRNRRASRTIRLVGKAENCFTPCDASLGTFAGYDGLDSGTATRAAMPTLGCISLVMLCA